MIHRDYPLSPYREAHRKRAANLVDAIWKGLGPQQDAGDYYDQKREAARRIREAIANEEDPDALAVLNRALKSAEYVGD